MTSQKKVLVIGAGPCGLTSIKACLEENLSVTCYEVTNHLGGVWKYTEEDQSEDAPSMFQNIYLNSSKEMTSFSDFPPPKECPNYMHNTLWYKYLESYAENFHLTQHIHFRHRVVKVVPSADYDSTGRWKVEVVDMEDGGKVKTAEFDFVMVAVGQHNVPFTPPIPGLEDFQGQKLHSRSFKIPEPFKDKRVLVYGLGNSGVDVATDVARFAKKVYLSSRSGNWITRRLGSNGMPSDAENNRRSVHFFRSLIPREWLSTILERRLNKFMDHKLYGLNPKHRFVNQIPRASDTLPNFIIHGMVKMKPNVRKMTTDAVIFEGEEKRSIDTVIFCTGYKCLFPFISKDIIDFEDRMDEVYKFVFPIRLRHHTIAFLGLTIPDQAISTVGELEARWASKVFTGKLRLPSQITMLAETKAYLSNFKSIHGQNYHHPTYVLCIPHMDDLASVIGAKPDLMKLLMTDPKLFWHCFFGPAVPYQYRLTGPNAWRGARKAILTSQERMKYPLIKSNQEIPKEIQWERAFVAFLFFVIAWFVMSRIF